MEHQEYFALIQKEVKAEVGLTPVEFIRSIRLNEAKSLLSSQDITVSEVAYSVGFNNLSYFSRSFKTEFGCLPSGFGGLNSGERNNPSFS